MGMSFSCRLVYKWVAIGVRGLKPHDRTRKSLQITCTAPPERESNTDKKAVNNSSCID